MRVSLPLGGVERVRRRRVLGSLEGLALPDGGSQRTAPKVPEVGAACAAPGPPTGLLFRRVRLPLCSSSATCPAAWADVQLEAGGLRY